MDAPADPLRLALEIRTLEGEVLVEAGTRVDGALLMDLAAAGGRRSLRFASLLDHGTVRRDLAAGARLGTYAAVFGDAGEYRDLEALMASVRLPETCLAGLDRFRGLDPGTYRHILMVFALSCLLARVAGLEGRDVSAEIVAGPLHDFGKLAVPVGVLRKASPLTRGERRLLEQHTLAGSALLTYYFGAPEGFLARVARDHHERRDGSGYPRGIALQDRLVEIVAACDVYDALVSPRPYRSGAYDSRGALEELTALAARGALGWEVVRTLVALHRRGRPDPAGVEVSRERRGGAPARSVYGVFADEGRGRGGAPER